MGGRGEPSRMGAHSLRLRGTDVALLQYTEVKSKEEWTGVGPPGGGLCVFPKSQKAMRGLTHKGRFHSSGIPMGTRVFPQ